MMSGNTRILKWVAMLSSRGSSHPWIDLASHLLCLQAGYLQIETPDICPAFSLATQSWVPIKQ